MKCGASGAVLPSGHLTQRIESPRTETGTGTAAVSIVVPTLNEAENIGPLLAAVFAETEKHGLDAEVIVVDDGSKDGTCDRVNEWTSRAKVRLLQRTEKDGLAGAVLAGARAAQGGIVVVMDADLSHPPERIADLVRPILADTADMVVGSRYVRGGSTPGWPRSRRIASRLAAALAWPLTEVRDSLAGFFAVRRERLLAVSSDATGFKIGLEVIMNGGEELRVAEVPIVFRDRERGQSKMRLRVIWEYLCRLFAFTGVPLRNMERAGFFTVSGVLADLVVFHAMLFNGAGLGTSHIGGFAVASILNYSLRIRPALAERGGSGGWRLRVHLLVVLLMAVFFRGGVLSLLVNTAGWPVEFAILAAIGAATLVTVPGKAFCFASETRRFGPGMRWRMIAMGVLAYMVLLRLVYLGQPELLPEEAYYWNYSQHPDIGYLDHPPMVAWLCWLGTSVFGRNEFGVRIGAFCCWLLSSFLVLRFTRNLFGKSAGFVAVLLMQVLPFFFSTGLLMTPDAPMTACWAGALHALERVFIAGRARAWWLVGMWMGLGMLSKYSIGLVGLSALVFILLDPASRRWLLRWEPYAATLLGVLIFSPVILWNARTDWASFNFQTSRRLAQKPRFTLHALIASALALLTPTGCFAAFLALRGNAAAVRGASGDPARRRALFILVFTLVPLSVFVVFSLRHQVKFQWIGPLWLALLPAIAAGLVSRENPPPGLALSVRRNWEPTIATLVLIYGAAFHYLVLGLPGVPYSPVMNYIPVGWRDLVRQVDDAAERVRQETGRLPLVVGLDRYFTSSEFAFYSRDRDAVRERAAGVDLFGSTSLMYGRWFPPREQEGRDVLLVFWDAQELEQTVIAQRATRLGPISHGVISRDGRTVRSFCHRVLYGYRYVPFPPPVAAGSGAPGALASGR